MSEQSLLLQIQQLQFTAREDAEALLFTFVCEAFPELNVERLELRPQAISLNSFNGFMYLADGRRLFFKTHVEQDNVISEYYNARMLADAGYPVIQPLFSSTRSGQQILIYPVVEHPSVFEVARKLEVAGQFSSLEADKLTVWQHRSDEDLYSAYSSSIALQPLSEALTSPIHQLFWHRLTGGRLERFYGASCAFTLPHGTFTSSDVFQKKWSINGASYNESLSELVRLAVTVLAPTVKEQYSIIGHGDAHNGNVFLTDSGLVYFDPAFAGRHSPLLDLVKPLFHNVFAMWMYFPQVELETLTIDLAEDNGSWVVSHNYELNALRAMFFESKVDRVLVPTLRMLKERNGLREDWRKQIKLALMCCPLLTMNLTGFPPEIALLGLCFSVQMGAESLGRKSLLDSTLDKVEASLVVDEV